MYIQEQPRCWADMQGRETVLAVRGAPGNREQFDNERVNFPEVVNVLRRAALHSGRGNHGSGAVMDREQLILMMKTTIRYTDGATKHYLCIVGLYGETRRC